MLCLSLALFVLRRRGLSELAVEVVGELVDQENDDVKV